MFPSTEELHERYLLIAATYQRASAELERVQWLLDETEKRRFIAHEASMSRRTTIELLNLDKRNTEAVLKGIMTRIGNPKFPGMVYLGKDYSVANLQADIDASLQFLRGVRPDLATPDLERSSAPP